MCIKSTLYRVTYKGRDSRDDCTDFFCVCFLIFTIPCNCKFFFMNPIFLFSPPPYICLQPDNTCFILFFSLGGSVYYRARSSENMRGGLQCSTGCPTNHDSGKTTCRSSLMYFAACLCQPNFKLKLKLYN